MTRKEARLERRLCERERELIAAELHLAWYRERWFVAAAWPGVADAVALVLACKRAETRRRAA